MSFKSRRPNDGRERAAALISAFKGRETHGILWSSWQGRYSTIYRELRPDDAERHLKGTTGVVCIPLRNNGKVYWGAIDLDGLSSRGVNVIDIVKLSAELGAPFIVARSKSGDAHLYRNYGEEVDAQSARFELAGWAARLGFYPDDNPDNIIGNGTKGSAPPPPVEIFPKQTRPGTKGSGSGLALPYLGDWSKEGTSRKTYDGFGNPVEFWDFISAWSSSVSPIDDEAVSEGRKILPKVRDASDRGGVSSPDTDDKKRDRILPRRRIVKGDANISEFQSYLGEAWVVATNQQRRHYLALGSAGMLKKAGVSFEEARAIVTSAAMSAGDTELADRVRAVDDTYSSSDDVAGWSSIKDSIGDDWASRLGNSLFPKRWSPGSRRQRGNNGSAGGSESEDGEAEESDPMPDKKSPPDSDGVEWIEDDPESVQSEDRVPTPPNIEPTPTDNRPDRRPAVEVIKDLLIDDKAFSWREGNKCYSERDGMYYGMSEISKVHPPECLEVLLSQAEEAGYMNDDMSDEVIERGLITIWKRWSPTSYQEIIADLPERSEAGGIARSEAGDIGRMIAMALAKSMPVNLPDQPVFYASVLDFALRTQSDQWVQISQRAAYVRRMSEGGIRIAVRYDFILDMVPKEAAKIGNKTQFAKICSNRSIGKSKPIYCEGATTRAVVLDNDFVDGLLEIKGEIISEPSAPTVQNKISLPILGLNPSDFEIGDSWEEDDE